MKQLFAVLFVVTAVVAAEARAAQWTVGFKGGVSIATAGGSDAGDVGSRTAFVGGFYAQADFSKSLGVRFEGLYFMKGVTYDDVFFDGALELDYVEFPVLLVGQAPVSKTVMLNAFAGPSFAINSNATAVFEFGAFEASEGIDESINDFDIGLTFGAGATFQAGSVVIVLDGRYDLGLTSFDDTDEEADLKNEAWGFMVGVGFPIGTN